MPDINSISELKKVINTSLKNSLLIAGKKFEETLVDKIYDEWYRRNAYKNYAMYGNNTGSYERTWQLPRAVESGIADNGGVDIYIDPKKLRPIKGNMFMYSSYMSKDDTTSYGEQTISEWVIEWIEYGNKWPWMKGQFIHEEAEREIVNKGLDDKEMVKALKSMGIDAEEV